MAAGDCQAPFWPAALRVRRRTPKPLRETVTTTRRRAADAPLRNPTRMRGPTPSGPVTRRGKLAVGRRRPPETHSGREAACSTGLVRPKRSAVRAARRDDSARAGVHRTDGHGSLPKARLTVQRRACPPARWHAASWKRPAFLRSGAIHALLTRMRPAVLRLPDSPQGSAAGSTASRWRQSLREGRHGAAGRGRRTAKACLQRLLRRARRERERTSRGPRPGARCASAGGGSLSLRSRHAGPKARRRVPCGPPTLCAPSPRCEERGALPVATVDAGGPSLRCAERGRRARASRARHRRRSGTGPEGEGGTEGV